MEISPEIIIAVGTVIGSLAGGAFTAVVTGLYWLLKLRKDVNAAHASIRRHLEDFHGGV